MYLKLPDIYPYDLARFKEDFPNTSPLDVWTNEALAEFGIYPVTMVAQPACDPRTEYCTELPPQLIDGVWTQVFEVMQYTSAQQQELTDQQAAQVRSERDQRITATDWWVVRAYEAQSTISEVQEAYRQALRDVPLQPGFPWEVTWPDLPS